MKLIMVGLILSIIAFLSWWIYDSYEYDKDLERDFTLETGLHHP